MGGLITHYITLFDYMSLGLIQEGQKFFLPRPEAGEKDRGLRGNKLKGNKKIGEI